MSFEKLVKALKKFQMYLLLVAVAMILGGILFQAMASSLSGFFGTILIGLGIVGLITVVYFRIDAIKDPAKMKMKKKK